MGGLSIVSVTFQQSAENCGKKRHRFWLRLRHAVILISNDRTSASKKINGMALIRTLMLSTTAFDRTKEKFYGFRQTTKEHSQKFPCILSCPPLGRSSKTINGIPYAMSPSSSVAKFKAGSLAGNSMLLVLAKTGIFSFCKAL